MMMQRQSSHDGADLPRRGIRKLAGGKASKTSDTPGSPSITNAPRTGRRNACSHIPAAPLGRLRVGCQSGGVARSSLYPRLISRSPSGANGALELVNSPEAQP